ncbi:MAG: phosphoribosylformylglycinamidine cyclo-ligase, partial [Planctomycetota bacterium]
GDVGLFGGLFDLDKVGAGRDHVLVASADGVGTKLNVARMMGVYDSVGRDLVQHCIGDILVQGARPLFFMDYVGTGELDPEIISAVISGCADACADNGLALLGGETAEMPGVYQGKDFDLVGFIVGVVHRSKILDGSRIRPGQKLLGLPSSGLHTNGYSLARKIAFERLGHDVHDKPKALEGDSVGEALLRPHRSYLSVLWPLLEAGKIAGMAHITGGGLVENPPRALPGCHARIDRESWTVPPLFRWLCEAGEIEMDERYRVFNMGIGMVLAVDESDVASVRQALEAAGEPVFEIGDVADEEGETEWLR